MNVPIVRAIDMGRNYALAGAFTACLAGGLTIAPDSPRASAPVLADVALDIPLPDEPPPIQLNLATLPRLEKAIPMLPMPTDLLPFSPGSISMTMAGEPPVETTSEARPMHGRLSHAVGPMRRQVTAMQVTNSSELTRAFEAHDYTLEQARRGEPVPALQVARVPGDLVNVKDGNERKAIFIKVLLPIVLEANERILAERDHLTRIYDRHMMGRSLSVIERMWLAEIADRYGTEATNFVELLRRVDVVPPSMAIAQAGVESGWGTSYAARVGNALFGQIQPNGRHSVAVPWKPGPAMPQPFSTVTESVEAYFLNLNTHFAYAAFRAERNRLRTEGKEIDGHQLIGQLVRYSELGHGYIRFVRAVIRENRLSDFDRAKLNPI